MRKGQWGRSARRTASHALAGLCGFLLGAGAVAGLGTSVITDVVAQANGQDWEVEAETGAEAFIQPPPPSPNRTLVPADQQKMSGTVSGVLAQYGQAGEGMELFFGAPETHMVVRSPAFTSCVDFKHKIPAWVAEFYSPQDVLRDSSKTVPSRKKAKPAFAEDLTIPTLFRAKLSDYSGSGLHRGHLAPAAYHKSPAKDLQATFLLSRNIVPQSPRLNTRAWRRLERWCADLTIPARAALPVFTRGISGTVCFDTVGPGAVSTPTHLCKVVLAYRSGAVRSASAKSQPGPSVDVTRA
eukprot:CAMPEP_0177631966 /NCGR_PEP_ID=MMETSP0447-20121125/2033_1 /TAXON_ID=0 /ORGANISM="Stygamoeba regulata, Strain BSH-02190019" /LENGTH=296 /DNA_ID=CAMNT_0019133489 /DNA_START=34 /DNA_END=921 /DNA_ORIENTATION=+